MKRCTEDFECENCGNKVVGDGYTNHCPKCLYSKHVDIEPGDRLATCGGLMEPSHLEKRDREIRIVHICNACGHEKPNRTAANDSLASLINKDQSSRYPTD